MPNFHETMLIPQVFAKGWGTKREPNPQPLTNDHSMELGARGPFKRLIFVDGQDDQVLRDLLRRCEQGFLKQFVISDRILKPGWMDPDNLDPNVAAVFLHSRPISPLLCEQALAYLREYQHQIPFAAVFKLKSQWSDFMILLQNLQPDNTRQVIHALERIYSDQDGIPADSHVIGRERTSYLPYDQREGETR